MAYVPDQCWHMYQTSDGISNTNLTDGFGISYSVVISVMGGAVLVHRLLTV